MFVHRTYGVAAAALGVVALGCADPELNTELRPEGPPDVLAVLVMTDASFQLSEQATYCRPNDEKRPGLVGLPDFTTQQVCPETLSDGVDPVDNAYPDGWYVRIMFDELLDPSIETLTEILDSSGEGTGTFRGSVRDANPVTLECQSVTNNAMVNVDYDGYYSPSGNRVTWPVGPSLVIKPNDPLLVATGKECQITINESVVDKSGNPVPETQRGPYPFRIAPIKVIATESDDAAGSRPISALYPWFDNFYLQFNTEVTAESLCPDDDGDFNCDAESTFSFRDTGHPEQGPGVCDVTDTPCGTFADCDSGLGDTLCGRGFCGVSETACNTSADCPSGETCNTNYAYSLEPYGFTNTEYAAGPVLPLQTERSYVFAFTQGAKLVDRCGAETTLGAADPGDLTQIRFATAEFGLTGTSILNGEVPTAMRRLQFNFNNVLQNQATATAGQGAIVPAEFKDINGQPSFTITPSPKKLTGPCTAGTCQTEDLTPAEQLIVSPFFDGQTQVQGHLELATEYTATLKAGTVVKDFYGASWTADEDITISWTTQPAIQLTGLTARNTGELLSVGNNGTLVRPSPATTTDIYLSFNASMDPTTLDLDEIEVEPAVPGLAIEQPSGCGGAENLTGWYPSCSLRLRGAFAEGTYKITLLAGSELKDIFGVAYTQANDASITIEIEDAPSRAQCL